MNCAWIIVLWQREILHWAELRRGDRFRLGAGKDAWAFPELLLGTPAQTLVEFRSEGPYFRAPKGTEWSPEDGQRARLVLGDFEFLWLPEESDPGRIPWRKSTWDLREIVCWTASASLVLGLVAGLAYSVPVINNESLMVSPRTYPLLSLGVGLESHGELDIEPPPSSVSLEPSVFLFSLDGTRCGGEDPMGVPTKETNARYAIMGPKDNPDPHIRRPNPPSQLPPSAPEVPLIGSIAFELPVDSASPSMPWGRDTSLGTDEVSARGNMWGDTVGIANGAPDTGQMGVDGGKVKRVDVIRDSSLDWTRPPRIVHTDLRVEGPTDPARVERSMLSRLAPMRDCYRADVSSHGNQEGRLEIELSVGPDGTISNLSTSRAQNVSPALAECMLQAVAGLSLSSDAQPQAEASHIKYPVLLVPGVLEPTRTEASEPRVTIPLAPDLPHSTGPVQTCSGQRLGKRNTGGPCRR